MTDEAIAREIHYPRCWDTVAYPTLASALWELLAQYSGGCLGKCACGEQMEPFHPCNLPGCALCHEGYCTDYPEEGCDAQSDKDLLSEEEYNARKEQERE